ncbi:hypothetical protein LX36DRAFT_101687 [Colletotrichum falcatum]|nr:hypothetical protein LX36DRAFT_101687 [Colletotrichum falcatum]
MVNTTASPLLYRWKPRTLTCCLPSSPARKYQLRGIVYQTPPIVFGAGTFAFFFSFFFLLVTSETVGRVDLKVSDLEPFSSVISSKKLLFCMDLSGWAGKTRPLSQSASLPWPPRHRNTCKNRFRTPPVRSASAIYPCIVTQALRCAENERGNAPERCVPWLCVAWQRVKGMHRLAPGVTRHPVPSRGVSNRSEMAG